MILTTTEKIANKEVEKTLGLVKGNVIQSKHVGKDIIASFKQIIGGEIKQYTEMLSEAREIATKRMITKAEKLDADAIINVRFMTSMVMTGAAEILAYGTAVKLKKD
ncbi:YbjQ family protein [Candidatus Woesearchaeota archaeon]|jgi:uncharacterized protein YbjQ (UPF0145 family)|nr:YbjQ family protein [Candidatus Woesearchaeota archaeon]MBT7237368.1 YbjQ family protein [Candidatus Woesearchaeota archaeon]